MTKSVCVIDIDDKKQNLLKTIGLYDKNYENCIGYPNCRELAEHPRNLTDEMIWDLANTGGIAGLKYTRSSWPPGP